MKVDQRYLEQAGTTRLDRPQEAQSTSSGKAKSGKTGSGERSDQVELSNLSEHLLDAAKTDQPGHAARLEQLAAAVRGGTYHMDDAETAKKLIQGATINVAG